MTAKQKPADRKKQILDGAVAQAVKDGYQNITRQAVAERVGVSVGLINLHFATMPQLKRAVLRQAVTVAKRPLSVGTAPDHSSLVIIAQGLAAKDPQATKAPPAIKELALATLNV